MKRDTVIQILRDNQDELRQMGIKSLALFGSTARGEARNDSDMDLLVEFEGRMSLFGVFRIQRRLEELLQVMRVDLLQRDAVHPALRDLIYREAINVA